MKKICFILCAVFLMCACNSDKSLFQKAKLATSKGQLQQALELYTRLIKQNPKFAPAYVNRGILWEQIPVKDAAEKSKNLDYAQRDYLQSLVLNPNQAEPYNNLGALSLDRQQYGDAIFYFTQALALRPSYFMARMNRAIAYSKLGQLSDALNDFSQAAQQRPNEPLVYLNRGLTYYDREQYEAAIEDYSRVLSLTDNQDARAFLERARAFIKLGYPANAYADLEEAVSIKPTYALAYYYMADLQFRRGEKDAALALLVRAKELANHYAPIYELMGDMLSMEDPVAAVSNYKVALQLDPAHASRYQRKLDLMRTPEGRDRILGSRFFPRS